MTGTELLAWLRTHDLCHTSGPYAGLPDYREAAEVLGYAPTTLKAFVNGRRAIPLRLELLLDTVAVEHN